MTRLAILLYFLVGATLTGLGDVASKLWVVQAGRAES
jgi:hypothetical protein